MFLGKWHALDCFRMSARLPIHSNRNARVGAEVVSGAAASPQPVSVDSLTGPLWVIASATSYLAWGIVGSVLTGLSYFAASADFRRVLEAAKSNAASKSA